MLQKAYLLKYYPENFEYMIGKMKETEEKRLKETGKSNGSSRSQKYNATYIDTIVRTKWLNILEEREKEEKARLGTYDNIIH